eukprot:Platyproteum_vivax@DN4314_c0_g1_i1.p1
MSTSGAVVEDYSRIPISNNRSRGVYVKAANRLFVGADEKEPLQEITLTGLGTAINSAVVIADTLEKQKLGLIKKVETSYHLSESTGRHVPKITFWVTKHPEFVPLPIEEPKVEAKPETPAADAAAPAK